jgi:glycosyltransferase involved in cell wall biosynthesis
VASTEPAAPLVSVLLPCWNAEGSIAQAMGSVLQDRSVSLELVVVDDGSTDRTAEIAAGVAAGDERVVLVRLPENAGVSNARNVGLDRIRGDWLTLLDADDRFAPGGVGILARAALETDARAVIGQQVWWDGRRRWITSLYDIPDIRSPGRKSLVANPGLLNSLSPHAKLVHRSTFEGLRFSGRVLGDQPWIIRALLRAGTDIFVLEDTVYEWYRPAAGVGPPSITSTTRSSARRSIEAVEVAIEAFDAVGAEAALRLDAAGRELILRRYAERLAQSDLGPFISRALRRHDAAAADLIDAVHRFVAGSAGPYLAGGPAMARDLLEPPLRRWSGLDDAGRRAYWRLAATILALDPEAPRRRPTLGRLGLAAGLGWRNVGGHTVATALLGLQWLADGAGRRLRRRLRR